MINLEKSIPIDFYQRNDVVQIARELVGKIICRNVDGEILKGIITETEAYRGENDKACHAHLGRFTKRTSTMYMAGGVAYIYLCYGIHHLFNIVTNVEGKADAVLIRAIEPIQGIDFMKEKRNYQGKIIKIAAGPGKLTQALSINKQLNNEKLVVSSGLWVEESTIKVEPEMIISSKRIGIDYAEEDADLLWRFYLKKNNSVSRF
jgi:DNA-3-methyladenine glycosylase